MKICLIVPVYNHQEAIRHVVAALKPLELPCILINDGSSPACTQVLQSIADKEHAWLSLYERPANGGKGAAVMDGFRQALAKGFSHAIQIDADGQHKIEDIQRFVQAAQEHPRHLILGQPQYDASAPRKRLYGRQFTNLWVWINTLSFAIADAMCGFRCYPLAALESVLNLDHIGQRMDFDIEVVVRLYWQGVEVINLPTEVQYPLDGVSHFDMLKDNLLISRKHAQLFFGMLWRFPKLMLRWFR